MQLRILTENTAKKTKKTKKTKSRDYMYFFRADKEVDEYIQDAIRRLRLPKVTIINDMIRHGHDGFWLEKEREILEKAAAIKNGKKQPAVNNQLQKVR